ncbi:MAG: hypothetical protein ACYC5X_14380 [Syntrophales bacterium]
MATTDESLPAPLTREAMHSLVWKEPMLKVAARYGVSSSYLARICKLMNVPRPGRGYWAMRAAGKKPPIPPLSHALPGNQLTWSRGGHNGSVALPLPHPPVRGRRRPSWQKAERPSQHPLVDGVKSLFEKGRYKNETGYLRPDKQMLVDLIVTKPCLDKALAFASQLFLALEDRGYPVVLEPRGVNFYRAAVDEHEVPAKTREDRYSNHLWSPCRCTVVCVGTAAIGLTIVELAEEVELRYVNGKYIREADYVPPKRNLYAHELTWTTKKDYPTGRLCLQAYAPYRRANWVQRWQESKKRDLGSQIKKIIRVLKGAAGVIARLVEEGERQAEIERQEWEARQERWRREEAVRRAAQARKESREELFQIIERWGTASRIEQFFRDAEQRAVGLAEVDRVRLLERLKLAREMVGSVDALDRFLAWRAPEER